MRTDQEHRDRERARYWAKKIWVADNGAIPKDEFGKTYQIHHKDRNYLNNNIENLQCVSRKEHELIHLEERRVTAIKALTGLSKGNQFGRANRGKVRTPEMRARISEARRGTTMSDATKRKIAATNMGKNKGRKKSPEEVARREAAKAAKRALDPGYGQAR